MSVLPSAQTLGLAMGWRGLAMNWRRVGPEIARQVLA